MTESAESMSQEEEEMEHWQKNKMQKERAQKNLEALELLSGE